MHASSPAQGRRPRSMSVAAIIALLFGLATLGSGGQVLFGPEQARLAAGQVVPFVLWFNFLSGFVYVAAAVGLWRTQRWGAWLASALALGLALVFAYFLTHVAQGGAYESRTLYALMLRLTLWSLIAAAAHRALRATASSR